MHSRSNSYIAAPGLLDLKKKKHLPFKLYEKLRCSSGTIPAIYGLPKIHKEGFPLRPIVSFCSSPTYNLSKFLAQLLTLLVGRSPSAVTNSRNFVSFISSEHLHSNEILVSFDVVSLFTKLPVSLVLKVAKERLEADDTLSDRTSLHVRSIISLWKMCLDATYFVFRGTIYQQIFVTANGFPSIYSSG